MGKKAASRVMEEDGGGLKERLKVALDKTAKDLKELQARGGVPARPSLTSGGVVGVLAGSRSNNDNVEEANDPWARTSPSVDDEGSPSSSSYSTLFFNHDMGLTLFSSIYTTRSIVEMGGTSKIPSNTSIVVG